MGEDYVFVRQDEILGVAEGVADVNADPPPPAVLRRDRLRVRQRPPAGVPVRPKAVGGRREARIEQGLQGLDGGTGGDPVRLTICCALAQGETNPTCLAELAGVPVQGVSQHRAKLRLAGAVRPRRDGQRVWYELADPDVRDLVEHLVTALRSDVPAATGTEARA